MHFWIHIKSLFFQAFLNLRYFQPKIMPMPASLLKGKGNFAEEFWDEDCLLVPNFGISFSEVA